jgi:hypothetical protein
MALYPATSSRINAAYHAVSSLLILVGAVLLVKRLWRSYMMLMGATYVVMLLTAEVDSARYVWPLFPIGVAAFALGASAVAARVRDKVPAVGPLRLAAGLLAAVASAATVREMVRPRPNFLVGSPDGEALFDFLRSRHAEEPTRVVFSNPRVIALETGVPAMGNVGRSPAGHLAAYDQMEMTHFVWQVDSLADCLQKVANTLPESHPERFTAEYTNASFRVYRVLPPETTPVEEYRNLRWAEYEHC